MKKLLSPVSRINCIARWLEYHFWDEWFRTQGLHWPEGYNDRIHQDRVIDSRHEKYIDFVNGDVVKVLDVGSGPITLLSRKHPRKKLLIQCCDPLEDVYRKLRQKYHVDDGIDYAKCKGEELSQRYRKNEFDLVTATNCVDHAGDPAAVIRSMVAVCRDGGIVALHHGKSAGYNEDYFGLHKWNFNVKDGHLIISDRRGKIFDVSEEFKGEVLWKIDECDGWIFAYGIVKH